MEMKENIYPILPADEGQGYRLQKINEIQNFLEGEVVKREALSKKYFRSAKIVGKVDSALIAVTLASGARGVVLLWTVVAIPAVTVLEIVSGVTGLLSLVGKYIARNSTTKGEKHENIKIIASTKLNTISSHVSIALSDNKVMDEEFQLIMEELVKYKKMKEEIRSKSKKKMTSEKEATLIERGRREQRESFQRLVEKHNGGPLEY